MLKSLLKASIRKYTPPENKEVALLLSGGVDSISIGICLEELGYKVHTYTFYLKDNYSYDAQKAKEISETLGFESHTEVEVDARHDEYVYSNIQKLIKEYDANSKTLVECLYPHLDMLKVIKQDLVFFGLYADTHFGSSKNATMAARRSHEEFVELKTKAFSEITQKKKLVKYVDMYKKFGKTLACVYIDDDIFEYLKQYTWKELNSPKQKNKLREIVTEKLPETKVKPHWNYQKCAGICDVFENHFLNNPKYNYNNRKRMMDVYRDWSKDSKATNTLDSIF